MAHGGTNWGFYNGANTGGNDSVYLPDLTSYDYVRNSLNTFGMILLVFVLIYMYETETFFM